MKKVLMFLVSLIVSTNALADCYVEAAEKYNLDPNILRAVTLVESSGSEFALNIGGRAFFPQTYEEAVEILENAKKYRVTFDVGVQQINKFWLDKFYSGNYHYALDACFNIELSAAIIDYERSASGSNNIWEAVGRYHSKTPHLKSKYIARVVGAYNRLRN